MNLCYCNYEIGLVVFCALNQLFRYYLKNSYCLISAEDRIMSQTTTFPFEIIYCGFEAAPIPWEQNNIFSPVWRLWYNFQTAGHVRTGDEVRHLQAREFMILPGKQLFSTWTETKFDQFYIHFVFTDNVKVTCDDIFTVPSDTFSDEYINEFSVLYKNQENRLRCDTIAHTILGHVLLKSKDSFSMYSLPPDTRIYDICQYISTHLQEKMDNTFLARRCGLARNAFVRLFSEKMGEAPQTFIRRKRIERACYLLQHSSMSLKEISHETGFADQYHFSKVFGRLQYNTPQKYRESVQAIKNTMSQNQQ